MSNNLTGLGPGDNWSIISWVLVSVFAVAVTVTVTVMVADGPQPPSQGEYRREEATKNRQKDFIQETLLTLCSRKRFHIGSRVGLSDSTSPDC